MTDSFADWNAFQSILDEILYRDPSGSVRQMEVRDGATRMQQVVTFADGSRLVMAAQVPMPPLDGMTPHTVSYLRLNGERGERLDDGSGEAMELARQSAAARLLEGVARMLDGMPQCEMMACPDCNGRQSCPECGGQGCFDCGGTGRCLTCDGHGQVAR